MTLLAILVWAPLPFASNVLWAEMLLCLLVFVLTVFVLFSQSISFRQDKQKPVFPSPQAKWAMAALVMAQIYVALQLAPGILNLNLPTGHILVGTIDPQATAVMLLSGLALCCTFYLVLVMASSEKRAKIVLYTLVCSGVFQATYGSIMTLSGIEYSFFLEKNAYRGVATGTFINRNHLAGYLVLTLACGIGLMIAGMKRGQIRSIKDFLRSFIDAIISGKGALRIGLVIMVVGLVLTRSRMGNTSFFVGLAIAGLGILISSSVSKKTIGIFLVSILLIDALIISSFFDLDKLAQRLETTSAETENRDEIFKLSLPMVLDRPLFGTGAGSFYTNYPAYQDNSAGGGFYVHAHNDYIEFLSERGFIGVIPLGIFFLLAMKQGMLLIKSKSSRKRGMGFTVLMSGIAIVLHSTVDFNLQMPAYALTLVAIWALAFSSTYLRKERKN